MVLSPSEGNLKDSAKNNLVVPVNAEDDERGHVSDVSCTNKILVRAYVLTI